jgi:L-iditol 2-dehydrogenase
MKAAVLEAPRSLAVRDVADPAVADHGALVRVEWAGVCGSDLKLWRFGSPRLRLPAVIGHEVLGRLEIAPPPLSHLRGRRVVTTIDVPCFSCPPCREGRYTLCDVGRCIGWEVQGGFAEFLAIPREIVDAGGVLPVPDGLDNDEAVLAEPVGCALRGQEAVDIRPDDTVLVIGAGPMGYLHACLSRRRGARRVILCDLLARRLEQTADAPADARLLVDDRFERAVRDLTRDRGGPDVVIVAAATADAQTMAVRLAAKRGRVNFYASLPATEAGRFDINPIHSRELTVVASRNVTAASMQTGLDLLAARALPTAPLRRVVGPLDALPGLFERFDRAEILKPLVRLTA